MQIFVRFTVPPKPSETAAEKLYGYGIRGGKDRALHDRMEIPPCGIVLHGKPRRIPTSKKCGERRECKNSVLKRRKSDGLQSAYAGLQWKCRPALKRKAGFYALPASFHSKQPFAKYPVPAD